MKKKLLIGLLAAVFIVTPFFATAQTPTIEELRAEIARLQMLINELKAKLNQLVVPPGWCYVFNNNLSYGQGGMAGGTRARNIIDDDIHALRQVLTKEGLGALVSGDGYPGISMLESWFENATLEAVKKFQTKYGIPATGYVGPLTRAVLNRLYGCGVRPIIQNQPPVISGVSGPTTLRVGEQGTWTVQASDPENGLLSHFVSWGDEATNEGVPTIMASNSNLQTITFSHSYSRSGTFYPKFKVSDGSGQSAQTSISVVVGQSIDQDITVLSPNGGEVWQAYTVQPIRWQVHAGSGIEKVDLYLQPTMPPCGPGLGCIQVMPDPIVLDKNIQANLTYNWIVATDIVNNSISVGNYYVDVCEADSLTNCDSSDQTFNIYVNSGSLSPVISNVLGPAILRVGEQGTWTVRATDPENGRLNYQVMWSGAATEPGNHDKVFSPVQSTAIFKHVYGTAGFYHPAFIVTDPTGLSVESSLRVIVGRDDTLAREEALERARKMSNLTEEDPGDKKVYSTPEELYKDFSSSINDGNFDLFKQTIALEAEENYGTPDEMLGLEREIDGYIYDRYEVDPSFWLHDLKGLPVFFEGGHILLKHTETGREAKLLIMKINDSYRVVED